MFDEDKETCQCCKKETPTSELASYPQKHSSDIYICEKCIAKLFCMLPEETQLSYVRTAVEFRKGDSK